MKLEIRNKEWETILEIDVISKLAARELIQNYFSGEFVRATLFHAEGGYALITQQEGFEGEQND